MRRPTSLLLMSACLLLLGAAEARQLQVAADMESGPDKLNPLSFVNQKHSRKGKARAKSALVFDQTADAENCISTPAEFLQVWKSPKDADRNRCVDPSIIARIAVGRGPSSGDSLMSSLTFALSRLGSRPISFWAFKDAAEKYLRIGKPQIAGSYVNGFASNEGQNAPYLNSLYPSIKERSTGTHFLQQIGFSSTFYNAEVLYTLIVGKRPAPAALPSFVPTFENLRIYFNDYVQRYLASIGSNEAFDIPKEVVSGGGGFAGLANLDFAALTNCPAQCTYEDRAFPDLIKDVGELSTSLVPSVVTNHTQNMPNICQDPVVIDDTGKDIGRAMIDSRRLVPAAPTAVAETDWGCNALWSKYYIRGDFVPSSATPYPTWRRYKNPAGATVTEFDVAFPGFYELCNKMGAAAAMDALVRMTNAATSIEEKAMVFRAYLMTSCAGTFNALFSGNGFTYTGTGGIFSGTVHEVLLAQIPDAINATLNQGLLGELAYTFFCLDGSTNCCPTKEPNCEMA